MLSAAVNGLTNLTALVPVVRQLGARHANYGVRDEHYATVGSALLWALEQGLGDADTIDPASQSTQFHPTYCIVGGKLD